MKKNKTLIILTTLLIGTTLALATWWTYLLYVFGDRIEAFSKSVPDLGLETNIIRMLKWEATTFIILILFLTISFLIIFFKDHRKTKALHNFFASLTHELKTPLASIRLQSEVITDVAEGLESQQLVKLTTRLIEDTASLEIEMDKILQLSRLERGGKLNLKEVDLESIVRRVSNNYKSSFDIGIDAAENSTILADEFAIEIILKNLFENTKNHTTSKKVNITLIENENGTVSMQYEDFGIFEGDRSKLGTIFYKYNSKKGSGIGLYLIKKFVSLMNGEIQFKGTKSLETTLIFKRLS